MMSENVMRKRTKVMVAGHICLDITPVFPAQAGEATQELLVPGSLVKMNGVDIHTGGAVANTGLALKKFGMDVSLIGKRGRDEFGDILSGLLQKNDIKQNLIREENSSTSYSIVLQVPGKDRMFLHNSGVNDTFTVDDIHLDQLQEIALFHFGYPPLMQSMYDNNGENLWKMFRMVKQAGVATSLDLAAVDPSSKAAEADWKLILGLTLPFVDFFMPSLEELLYMLDREKFEKLREDPDREESLLSIDIDKDVKPLADACMHMGAKVVIIKCGALGMYYKTCKSRYLQPLANELSLLDWGDKEGFELSYLPDKVVSGTGAGDTCIAAFLASALQGYSFEDCIHISAAAGAACVSGYDALSGLLSLE